MAKMPLTEHVQMMRMTSAANVIAEEKEESASTMIARRSIWSQLATPIAAMTETTTAATIVAAIVIAVKPPGCGNIVIVMMNHLCSKNFRVPALSTSTSTSTM